MAQWVEQLTCIQEVAGSNPGGEKIFFENQYFLRTRFLKFSCYLTLQACIEMGLERN